jgi:hypothetical protein
MPSRRPACPLGLLEISLTRPTSLTCCADTPTLHPYSTINVSDGKHGRRKVRRVSYSPVEGLADNQGDDERPGGLRMRFGTPWTAR